MANCPCGRGPRASYGRKCSKCIAEQSQRDRDKRRGAPEARPTAPEPLQPLESAYKAHEDLIAKRDLNKERGALLEENLALKALLHEKGKLQRSPNILIYDKAKDERCDLVACALASDWHVEELVESAAVHGLNEYNPDIARERGRRFFQNLLKLTDIVARDSKVTTIWLGLLGDFFSGHIHEELMASTAMAPGDAAQLAKEIICSGIDFLLRESSYVIEGDCIPGNHGRMTKKVWTSDPTGTSLETFMYRAITDRYHSEPRVRLQVAEHAMVYRPFFESFMMRLIHGYEISYGGGVGGITIPIRKALAQWNIAKRASVTCLGHFHQRLDGGDHMVNGSLIGYSEYAQVIKASFERPVQSFFTVHARHGGEKGLVAPIWLDE